MEKHVEQRVEDVTYNKAKLWQIILFAMNNSSTNIYLVAFTFVTYLSTGVLGLAALFVSQLMGYIRIFDGFIDPTELSLIKRILSLVNIVLFWFWGISLQQLLFL